MASVECSLGCGNSVNPYDAGVWKKVTGYVGGPKKDSMRLRQDTGEYAHDACVSKLMEGQTIDQPDLFETLAPVTEFKTQSDLPEEIQ